MMRYTDQRLLYFALLTLLTSAEHYIVLGIMRGRRATDFGPPPMSALSVGPPRPMCRGRYDDMSMHPSHACTVSKLLHSSSVESTLTAGVDRSLVFSHS